MFLFCQYIIKLELDIFNLAFISEYLYQRFITYTWWLSNLKTYDFSQTELQQLSQIGSKKNHFAPRLLRLLAITFANIFFAFYLWVE